MTKMITVFKKYNHDGDELKNSVEVYWNYTLHLGRKHIQRALDDFISSQAEDLTDRKTGDVKKAENLLNGDYLFDCGEYTYTIIVR